MTSNPGLLHYDPSAERALTRRHAGNVRCGKNADRKRRTDDPAKVTCTDCQRRMA